MARAAVRRRLSWQLAEVVAVRHETPRASRLALQPPDWAGHVPGQHVDIRLTAPDGYTAQRSYSIASPPERPGVELVVERLADGEVSPYLTDELRPGDQVELRGPIGGYFVWPNPVEAPVQLVAGGSGVVPFLGMVARAGTAGKPVQLLYSVRNADDVIGRAELESSGAAVTFAYTRAAPPGWTGLTGRVDTAVLAAHTVAAQARPHLLVCGPTGFVEAVTGWLTALGHEPGRIRAERFGGMGEPS
jgi:ferredoxin-NADP reductase